ncbi:MAG: DUF2282 domain-containing protein [Alphaproteobacteria bacterium]|nr:DUF2282 domain-containing protein [Alphaproteobacteria bacterium]
MQKPSLKTVAGSSLLGALAVAAIAVASAQAAPAVQPAGSEKCFGIAKAAKNDCAGAGHSCAGQSTKNMDKATFVYLPAGACDKIAGSSMKAS